MTYAPFIALSAIKQRGWSDRLISKLLGNPDKTKRNPHYRNASPVKLYAVARVKNAEKHPEFVANLVKRAKRQAAAKKAVATKIANLLKLVEAMEITVEKVDPAVIRRNAIAEWNEWQAAHGHDNMDGPKADNATIQRWMVNHIRHRLTRYDDHLEDVARKTGVDHAVRRIRERVFAAIQTVYPKLRAECQKQKNRLF